MDEYKKFVVTGQPFVTPYTGYIGREGWRVLLMGPVGAGKSTFIESLSGNTSLKISSDQLEGFTKQLTPYIVKNVNPPIYLLDTPGFLDCRISDMEIILMVKKWIAEASTFVLIDRILYLTPVTETRISGSKKQIFNTLENLIGNQSASRVTLVTTMWDTLVNERSMRRAENNFEELRSRFFKDFIEKEAGIGKFLNTQHSALTIIDDALDRGVMKLTSLENMINFNRPLQRTAFGINAYQDLMNRIESLRLQKDMIGLDLENESTAQNRAVFMCLKSQLAKVQYDLDRFENQLREFGVLPSPHGSYPPSVVDVLEGGLVEDNKAERPDEDIEASDGLKGQLVDEVKGIRPSLKGRVSLGSSMLRCIRKTLFRQ